eukprot:m.38206 g.38206  ORF g.38206 m.38206 type:complete len:233 (+) comp6786_c0_seq1:47-745(+)
MGGVKSTFLSSRIDLYQNNTYLTRAEIYHIYQRYIDIGGEDAEDVPLAIEKIVKLKELKANPFKRRICEAFSERKDGGLTFIEFLDMFSVFNEKAPLHEKMHFAFKIYDYDGNTVIDENDLQKVVRRLCGLGDDQDTFASNELDGYEDDYVREGCCRGSRMQNNARSSIQFDSVTKEDENEGSVIDNNEVAEIVKKIMDEVDLDETGGITFIEFRNVVARSPNFVNTFRIKL